MEMPSTSMEQPGKSQNMEEEDSAVMRFKAQKQKPTVKVTPYDIKKAQDEDTRRQKVRSIYGLRKKMFDEYPDNFLFVKGSAVHGRGVFAGQYFARRSRLCLYIGEKINETEANRRLAAEPNGCNYMMRLQNGTIIDAKKFHGKAKFINHRCGDPNCEVKETPDGYLEIVNIEPLYKGTELSIDYKMNSEGEPCIDCFCRSPTCTGKMDTNERLI